MIGLEYIIKEMATEYEILSKKAHKAIICKAINVIDEEKVEEIVNKRPDANPFYYLYFRTNARSIGYGEKETNKKYKEIANKILVSTCPILTCFEELVLLFDLSVAEYASVGCIHHHYRILDGDDYY